jgi:hypothetical protein
MRQNIVSHLRADAEYCVVANGMAGTCWVHQLLVELYNPLSQSTLIYCDNANAVYLSINPVQH